MSIKLFFCYAHDDAAHRDELDKHLSPLRDYGPITDWYDRKILPGDKWDDEIRKHLEEAQIILVLVSANMLASRYINQVELAHALVRHAEKTACVLPVILSDCLWQSTPLGNLQALPPGAKPILNWSNRNTAYRDVVVGINEAAASLQEPIDPTPSARIEQIIAAVKAPQIPKSTALSVTPAIDNKSSKHPNEAALKDLIANRAGIIVLRATNQTTAHSVLTSCLHTAFKDGTMVVRTDLVAFKKNHFADAETFFVSLVRDLNRQVRITKSLSEMWDEELGGGANLTYFLRDAILPKATGNLVWVVNAVDRLLDCDFHSEVFACFRSIFNLRAMDPSGGWDRLTILLLCTSDPTKFIDDPHMSPFNVGTWLDFD